MRDSEDRPASGKKAFRPCKSAENPVSGGLSALRPPAQREWDMMRKMHKEGRSSRKISAAMRDEGVRISHTAISKHARTEGWSCPPVVRSAARLQKRGDGTDVKAFFFDAIGRGATPFNAAAAAGITKAEFDAWKKSDPAFAEEIELQRRVYLASREENIAQAGDRGDFRANLAVLERSPESQEHWASKGGAQGFGPKLVVHINVGDPKPVDVTPIIIDGDVNQGMP